MEDFIRSGRIADVILVAIAVETLIAGVYFWRRRQALALLSFAASALAGGLIVLALRAALRESGWLFVAIYLAAALLAHLADLALRLLLARRAAGMPSQEQ
jgi:hypothetical protein